MSYAIHDRAMLDTDDKQHEQRIRAIELSNRLAVAKIKLGRSEKLTADAEVALKAARASLAELNDSLILGENVYRELEQIQIAVGDFETRIGA